MHLVRSKSVALIKSGQALSLRPDLLKSKIWAEELGKLVNEVGSFPDLDAMNIMREELSDLLPRIKNARRLESKKKTKQKKTIGPGKKTRLSRLVESDPVLSLFEFYNDYRVVASASIGQVVSRVICCVSIIRPCFHILDVHVTGDMSHSTKQGYAGDRSSKLL